MVTYVRQPKGTDLGGQACIAMIFGCEFEMACQYIGHKAAMAAEEICNALKIPEKIYSGDIDVGIFLQYHTDGSRHVMNMCTANPKGHWTLLVDGELYDPANKKDLWPVVYRIAVRTD